MSAHGEFAPVINRVTGDRVLVLHRGRDAEGEVLEVQFDLPPHAAGSPMHRHRTLQERFEVLDGVPAWPQRALFAVLVAVGDLLGSYAALMDFDLTPAVHQPAVLL